MKIYAFSGLGADQRIFKFLDLDCKIIPVLWIDPMENETLESYADRLSEQIDITESFGLLGVSFGGMLVSEIVEKLNPKFSILISSAACKDELPFMAPIAKKWNLAQKIPTSWYKPPKWTSYFGFPFHKEHRAVAQGIIEDMDPMFVKWALGAIVKWRKEKPPKGIHHIHGRWDPILPLKKRMNAEVMGAGHFIILKNCQEISARINNLIG